MTATRKLIDDDSAHRIAEAAIALDDAERALFEHERNSAYRAARDARAEADRLRAQLADAVAEAKRQ